MYQFKIHLTPIYVRDREAIDLNSTLDLVKKVAADFSTAGMKAANKKNIEANSIRIKDRNTIELVLKSEAWLTSPTKALRSFIGKLSESSPYRELITANSRLFKGSYEFLGEELGDKHSNEVVISDEAALSEIISLFFRESPKNRKKIITIKEILNEKKGEKNGQV